MMSIYEGLLIVVGAAAILLSLGAGNIRGGVWVAVILLDLVLSTAYWRSGLPFGDVFTGFCDFSVCALIYLFGRWAWELRLFLLYQLSMLVSIVDFGIAVWSPASDNHDVYSSMLEAINYIGFISIGGIGAFALAAGNLPAFRPWRWLRPSYLPLWHKGEKVAG